MKNNLKEVRLLSGLTQARLADQADVSRQTIISIETNRYTPSVMLALKLAEVLGKSVEELFQLERSDRVR